MVSDGSRRERDDSVGVGSGKQHQVRQNWAESAEGGGAANFPSASSVISAKSRVSLRLATCVRKDQLAYGASDFWTKEFRGCRGGQWRLALGRRAPPPAHSAGCSRGTGAPQAHLVLSESMVWKRPSSSVSLRTPSAKKSWNSSSDNFPSSAKGGGEQLVSERQDVPKSRRFPSEQRSPVGESPSAEHGGRLTHTANAQTADPHPPELILRPTHTSNSSSASAGTHAAGTQQQLAPAPPGNRLARPA